MRRALKPFLAAILILAAGYAGLWLYAEHQLEQGFHAWAEASRANGWKVSSAEPRQGTSLLAAILIVPDFSVAGGDDQVPGGIAWHAERVAIEVSLLHPRVVVVRAEGQERLRFSAVPEFPFSAGELRALVPLQLNAPPDHVDIVGARVTAEMPANPRGEVAVGHLDARLRWSAADARQTGPVAIALRATDILLPPSGKWPLGRRVSLFSGEAALSGRMPPIDSLARRVAAWRDSGGAVKAQRVTLTWGRLNLSGNGTFSLDSSLQPTATGTARVVDPSDTLSSLVARGVINRRTAFAANAVLALMEHAPEGGGAPVVEIPLSIQDRTVSVASIPLARLPAIVWPD
jgi:hypothetical protein